MPQTIEAVITAVGSFLPEDKLTNADIEKMVDTSDEWITTRVGIKERRVLKVPGKGASYLAIQAVRSLLDKSGVDPLSIEGVILATNTADYHFPTTSSVVAYETGCTNAFTFDLVSACPSWLYALETGANYIRSGRYKRLLVVATEKMSAAVDVTDRQTLPLFGDGSGCALLEAKVVEGEAKEGVIEHSSVQMASDVSTSSCIRVDQLVLLLLIPWHAMSTLYIKMDSTCSSML